MRATVAPDRRGYQRPAGRPPGALPNFPTPPPPPPAPRPPPRPAAPSGPPRRVWCPPDFSDVTLGLDLVPTVFLGAVQRLVGRAHHIFRVPVPLVPLGHADAHGDGLLVASLLGARAGGLLPRPQAAADGEGLPRHRLARPPAAGAASVARRAAQQPRGPL